MSPVFVSSKGKFRNARPSDWLPFWVRFWADKNEHKEHIEHCVNFLGLVNILDAEHRVSQQISECLMRLITDFANQIYIP